MWSNANRTWSQNSDVKHDWDLFVAGITLQEDGVLIVDRVKKDDEGLYECVAKNMEGVAKTSAYITVHGKTEIKEICSCSVYQTSFDCKTSEVTIATVLLPLPGCNHVYTRIMF